MADSSPLDSSTPDSSPLDSSPPDSSPLDSSPPDSSPLDSSPLDSSTPGSSLADEFLASFPKDMQWPSVPKKPTAIGIRYKKSIGIIRAKEPAQYKTIANICKLALRHYQESHPEKSYEFESVLEDEEVLVRVVGWTEYTLKFRAKNMTVGGNPVEVFQVTGDELIGGNLNIHKCTLLE